MDAPAKSLLHLLLSISYLRLVIDCSSSKRSDGRQTSSSPMVSSRDHEESIHVYTSESIYIDDKIYKFLLLTSFPIWMCLTKRKANTDIFFARNRHNRSFRSFAWTQRTRCDPSSHSHPGIKHRKNTPKYTTDYNGLTDLLITISCNLVIKTHFH